MDACRRTLDYLLGLPDSEPFRTPFDWEGRGLVDYADIVRAPMDLGTVKDNLDEGMYHSVEDFSADVRLVFENAIAYFPSGSPIERAAESLLLAFEERMQSETQQSDAMLAQDPGYSSVDVPPATAGRMHVVMQEREREAAAQHGQRLETAMRLIAEAASPQQQHQQDQHASAAGQQWGALTTSPARGEDADPAVHEVTAALLASQRQSQNLQEENQQLRAMLHFGASHESARRRRRLELAKEALPEGELQHLLAGLASGEESLGYGTRAADERRISALAHGDLRSAVGEVVDRVSAELRSQSQEHFDAERSDVALLSKDEMRLELERTRDGLLRLVQTYEESLKAMVERVDVVMGASQDTEAILKENAELRSKCDELEAALDSARAEAMRLTNEAEEASHAKRERDEVEQMHLSTNQAMQRQVHRLTEEKAQLRQQLQDLAKWQQRAQTEREEADYVRRDKEAQMEESARLREQVAQLTAAQHGAEQERDQMACRVQLLEKQLVMAEQTHAAVGL